MTNLRLGLPGAIALMSIVVAGSITSSNAECPAGPECEAAASSPATKQKHGALVDSNDGITQGSYGVDTSWPIHHLNISRNFAWLPHNTDPDRFATPIEFEGVPIQPLDDRAAVYEDFMAGCRNHYHPEGHLCDEVDKFRVEMSLDQPRKMTNYTELGFKKVRAPEAVFKLIKDFWDANKHQRKVEKLGKGYSYTNNWVVNTTMVSVEEQEMIGGGQALREAIWSMAEDTISEWIGRPLQTTSLYGIRAYHREAVLATHVDRLPLVSSAIINVDQDPNMDEDWPLEVYGHDGKVYNVTMKPGDMVLYESHSVLHGRPFALKGDYYANIFVHFEPVPLENTGRLAQLGDLPAMQRAAATDHHVLFRKDANDWQPLHEASRAGHLDMVKYLISEGANINARTKGGKTPMDLAVDFKGGKEMMSLIESLGGSTNAQLNARKTTSGDEL